MVEQETCGHTRDLYPAVPGKVLLVCTRPPHTTGKHSRRDPQTGRITEQWWGDR